MIRRLLFSILLVLLCGIASDAVCQGADVSFPRTRAEGDKCIKEENICEQLEKLRITHEKKEHEELLSRAEDALKLSEELERSILVNPQLSEKDRSKLQTFEKIVRKIRSELGAKDVDSERKGDEDVDTQYDHDPETAGPVDVVSGFKILRETTVRLVDEVRKSTRFTISAAAIHSSNAVLKLTRILRFWR